MTENYQFIVENIKLHQDKTFYSQIFNILTKNDSLKNYSDNNNGIFFDFNTLNKTTITKTVKFIKDYNRKLEEKLKYEKERTSIINKKNKKYTDTMQKLSNEIEKSILHTNIEETEENDNDISDVEMDIEQANHHEEEIDYKELFGESDED